MARHTRTRLAAWRLTALLALLSSASMASAAPAGCGDTLPARGRLHAEHGGWRVAFVPSLWPLPAGQHFEVDFEVCPPPGAPALGTVRLDADMPLHRHGMNYRASVQPHAAPPPSGADATPQRYRAEGLMFHMPGRWRFIFDLGLAGGSPVRLSHDIEVE